MVCADAALVIKPGMIARGHDEIRRAFIAISDHFQGQLRVEQGTMQVIEGAGDALVLMERCCINRMARARP